MLDMSTELQTTDKAVFPCLACLADKGVEPY